MELTHSFTVPTSVERAWDLFMDLEEVGGCFPGATVTEVRDDGFSGTVKVKLGPIALLYTGSGSFVERDDVARRAVIAAKGKDKRGNGTAGATVTIQLSPDGDDVRVDVATDLAVTGKPAQFGRGVMQDVSDTLLGQFVACIERRLGGIEEAAVEQVPEATVRDVTEAAERPEIVTEAVPHQVTETGDPLSLAEEVAKSKAEASGAAVAAMDTHSASAGPSATGTGHPPPGDTSDTHSRVTSAGSPGSRPSRRVTADIAEDDALDLGSAVMPVLIQRYAGFAAAAVVGLVLGWLVGRRRT